MKNIKILIIITSFILITYTIIFSQIGLYYQSLIYDNSTTVSLTYNGDNPQEAIASIEKISKQEEIDIAAKYFVTYQDDIAIFNYFATDYTDQSIYDRLKVKTNNTSYGKDKFAYFSTKEEIIIQEFSTITTQISDISYEYSLMTSDQESIDKYLLELKEIENLDIKQLPVSKNGSFAYENVLYFIILLYCMILMLNIFEIIKNQKYFALMKFNGIKKSTILISQLKKLIFSFIRLVVILLASYMIIMVGQYDVLFIGLKFFTVVVVIILLVLILIEIFSCILISFINPISAIKDLKSNQTFNWLFYLMKFIFMIIFILSLTVEIANFREILSLAKDSQYWNDSQNYAYTQTYGNFEDSEQRLADFYKFANEKDAILYNVLDYKNSNYVFVNDNFLLKFGYNIPASSEMQVLLPLHKNTKEEQDKLKAIKSSFKTGLRDEFDEGYNQELVDEENVDLFTYKQDIIIPTYLADNDFKFISNPTFIVIPDSINLDYGFFEFSLSNGMLYIPIEDPTSAYQDILPIIKKSQTDEIIKTTPTVYSRYANKITNIKTTLAKITFFLILIASVCYALILSNCVIYFKNNEKKIIVQKILGLPIQKRYTDYFLELICMYIIIGFLLYLINKVSFLVLFNVLVIDLVTSVIIILIYENKNIIKILKGD